MEALNFPGPRDEIGPLNQRAVEVAETATSILCEQVIQLAHGGVQTHLLADQEHIAQLAAQGYPVGSTRGLFVLQDKLVAPRHNKKFVDTFSSRLEPVGENEQEQYMVMHIPAMGEKIGDFQVPEVEALEEVYLEVGDASDAHWYAVSRHGLYEYIPLAAQETDKSVLTDQGIWQWVSDRIPEGLETVTTLFRRMANWETVPQRLETIQEIAIETEDSAD